MQLDQICSQSFDKNSFNLVAFRTQIPYETNPMHNVQRAYYKVRGQLRPPGYFHEVAGKVAVSVQRALKLGYNLVQDLFFFYIHIKVVPMHY